MTFKNSPQIPYLHYNYTTDYDYSITDHNSACVIITVILYYAKWNHYISLSYRPTKRCTHITTVPGFTTHTALTLQLLFNQLIFYRLLHVRLGLPQVSKKELLLVDGVRFCRPDSLPVIQPTVPQSSERINLSIQIIHLIQTHYQISSY